MRIVPRRTPYQQNIRCVTSPRVTVTRRTPSTKPQAVTRGGNVMEQKGAGATSRQSRGAGSELSPRVKENLGFVRIDRRRCAGLHGVALTAVALLASLVHWPGCQDRAIVFSIRPNKASPSTGEERLPKVRNRGSPRLAHATQSPHLGSINMSLVSCFKTRLMLV